MQNHFSEIHILVHALNGDVLDPDTMQHTCDFMHDVFAEQVRTGICLPQGSVYSIDTSTRSLSDATNDSSFSPLAAPLPVGLINLSDAYRGRAPDFSSQAEAPAPSAEAQFFADVLASDSPINSVFDEAFSPGSGPQEIIDSAPIECIPPFSIFNIRETVKQLGYGPQLLLLDKLAPMVTQSTVDSITSLCVLPPATRAGTLCSSAVPCDPLACNPRSVAGNSTGNANVQLSLNSALGRGAATGPQCLIAGIDPCDVLKDVKPTAEEIQKVIAIPDTPLDSQGCDKLDFKGLQATVEAFWVLRSWSQRSPIVAGASRVVDALLSADFGTAPYFSKQSIVSRIVFGVPRLQHTTETALGKYAADAADEYKTSTVEFVWRQCASSLHLVPVRCTALMFTC